MFRAVMDEAFIWVSVISGLFGIIGLELLTHNWFRKERFKIEAYNLKKQNDLQLKKMAKELGLDTGKKVPVEIGGGLGLGNIGGLIEGAKALGITDRQIRDIADIFLNRSAPDDIIEEEEAGGGSGMVGDALGEFLSSDTGRGLIKGLSQGLKNGTQKETSTEPTYQV